MQTFIIAEVGVNHNGDVNLAKKLIDAACDCGVDAVKFQTFISENLVTKKAKQAEYQITNTKKQESQLDMLKKLELSFDDFIELKQYCEKLGIMFMTTAFDIESLNFLIKRLNLKILKIPSGEITNLPYLEKCANSNLDIMLSTGMSTIQEVSDAYEVLKKSTAKISILHCTTEYPASLHDINLRSIQFIKKYFNVTVGYSDHTEGIYASLLAVASGAEIIEKHFTLDKNMQGPDHKASLNSSELKALVTNIREIEIMMGEDKKEPSVSEMKNLFAARKSIVAKTDIIKGEVFSMQNLTTKRPGNGISPMNWYKVLGIMSSKDYKKDELIEL